jgi:hypothetical protein
MKKIIVTPQKQKTFKTIEEARDFLDNQINDCFLAKYDTPNELISVYNLFDDIRCVDYYDKPNGTHIGVLFEFNTYIEELEDTRVIGRLKPGLKKSEVFKDFQKSHEYNFIFLSSNDCEKNNQLVSLFNFLVKYT